MPTLIRNPLLRKRLSRFRANRRAAWSLRILAIAYILSLGSELICNDRPLWMRHEGHWYFPVVRYYPESTFTGSERQTRPDYKALRQTPPFASGSGNFMVFPPFKHGPYASIDPASLRSVSSVDFALVPVPRVASLNVDGEFVVNRSVAAGAFFDVADSAVNGLTLSELWEWDDGLTDAVARRLRNESAPAFDATLRRRAAPEVSARVSLPAFTPRPTAPRDVRLSIREDGRPQATCSVRVSADGTVAAQSPRGWWDALPVAARAEHLALALRAFDGPVYADDTELQGVRYRVRAAVDAITWPHRPVRGHPLGIDSAGRDVLARIVYGFRTSISFGLLLVAATMLMGVTIGAIQGYFGGWVDLTLQRLIEIWSALPFLYVMILLGSVYGRGFTLLLVCYGIFNWIGISYYMRGEFLRLRRQPYIEAARCQGLSTFAIMARHILPNAVTPLITFLPFSLVGAIASLYGLDYLGFGLPPPSPSWGELLHQAQQFRWAWWLILYPAAAIFAVMLLGVFIGEGIRDAFDPRPFARME